MTDEMEYMNISQYCLNLIKNNIKLFFEMKYNSLIEKEYKSSDESYFDVMFYFNVLKKYLNEIKELPKVIINTIYNIKIFRNKIAHQVPITLREFYRFVDDTQIIIELLNICDQNEVIKIQNTRKEIIKLYYKFYKKKIFIIKLGIKRMTILDDNSIIIGSSYNAGNNINNNNYNLNINKVGSNSDIEMGEDDLDYFQDEKDNSEINNKCSGGGGKNYNNFDVHYSNNINNNNDKEEERKKKINENFNLIMSNTDKKNFMQVKKVNFSNL
jgi:hypothetical protein